MEMAVLMASPNPPVALRSKIEISQSQRNLVHYRASISVASHSKWNFLTRSTKIRAAEHLGQPENATSYLDNLVESLWQTSPKSLKEFPWKEAKDAVRERLLVIGQKALKWSIIVLFVVSSVSDVLLAISSNRELMIPLGLFIGVALADFFKESLHEYFQRSIKDESFKHLVGIGLFFVLVKIISLYLKIPRLVLSLIGDGGLMQVFWLSKELQHTENIKNQKEQSSDVSFSAVQ